VSAQLTIAGVVGGRHSSASNEHFTPPEIVDPGRVALGGVIDLDPASCALANRIVRATRIFTEADDGLSRPWGSVEAPSTVWLNAPGGKTGNDSNQARWWHRLVAEWQSGRVRSAVFVAFSVEFLQVAQSSAPPGGLTPLRLPFCVPSARVDYLVESAKQPGLFDDALAGLERGGSPPKTVFNCERA
jgi:hypothetical protein